jgi:hypothetical protein
MTDEKPPEKTHTGVRKKGDWEEISGFAEDVKDAMEKSDIQQNSVEKYDEWRPREDESIENIKDKTVEAASLSKQEAEEKTDGVVQDMEKASRDIKRAGGKVREGETPNGELKNASKEATRPFYSQVLGFARKIEERIYSAMVRFNSYYFDAEDVAVDIKQDGDDYEMEVKVPEDGKRKQVQDEMN